METRKIYFVIFPGFELLDLSGPVSVFSSATQLHAQSPYETHVISTLGGPIQSSAMLSIDSTSISEIAINSLDSIFIVGGNAEPVLHASQDATLIKWLQSIGDKAERIGSICSGTFILAETGLLTNKLCTSHWSATHTLKTMYPSIKIKQEALYVNDGKFWTSAGVTTGIDMALEILRKDLGNALSNKVAKMLVVYAHRPGNQTQFSSLLQLQGKPGHQFSELLSWIDSNIDQALKVEDMAEYMCMSERTFYRKFTAAFDTTPSKHLEEIKLDRAKKLLEENFAINRVANAVGFRSESAFRSCFEKRFKISPSMHRQLHRL